MRKMTGIFSRKNLQNTNSWPASYVSRSTLASGKEELIATSQTSAELRGKNSEGNLRRVFDNLLSKMNEDGRPLFRANWAIQNSSDLISTDLDWHPTNVRIGGVKNRKHLVEESSGFGDIDAMYTGYMDPTQGMPKNVGEVGE